MGETDNKLISRITIVVDGNDYVIEQVLKQLNKLVDVIKIRLLSPQNLLSRELVLVKLYKEKLHHDTISKVTKLCKSTFYEYSQSIIILELCEASHIIEYAIESLPIGSIAELVRTGVVALSSDDTVIACD